MFARAVPEIGVQERFLQGAAMDIEDALNAARRGERDGGAVAAANKGT